ncbi:MAG: hypothetical protein KGM98_15185 [Bacteroidota bacterium]|nr:hypothetical protein [Bacteroidota bacterium]
MKVYSKILILLLVCLSTHLSYGQIFGGNPPTLKWKQINTPLSRVIFPAGLDSTAQRVTNVIQYINAPTRKTIGPRTRKINLVLQNQTTISNAYVGLGPFRSEFLITPMQNSFELGSLPWPDQLVIHEYRHVEQYNNFNVGITRVLSGIFGEEGQALANNASIPNWFFEGDAVYDETFMSKQGRGRLPYFYDAYRALWQYGRNYSWMKLRNGSLKDFVPNHYDLGYLLVAYGRQRYGDDFWEKVTQDAAAFKGVWYPFQKAIKRYTGVSYQTFRTEGMDYFRSQFPAPDSSVLKNYHHKVYRDEEFPVFTTGGKLLFSRSGYQQVPEFVVKQGSTIRKIRTRANGLTSQFSYRNGRLVYASYRPDPRWGYRDYSELRVLNIATGKERKLTSRTKYFSPDINQEGTRIVAVRESPDTHCHLDLLDGHNGKLIDSLPNPDHLFYTFPKFYGKDQVLSAVRNSAGEMSLALIHIPDGKPTYLTPFSYSVLGYPVVKDDTVYYTFADHRNDALFAYTFSDHKIWRLDLPHTEGIGAYQPAVNDSQIVWSTFTADGFRLRSALKNKVRFSAQSSEEVESATSDFEVSALTHKGADLLQQVPRDSFRVSRYRKSYKLFHFHSIQPSASDPNYSLSLLSENILNTFQSQVGYTYNRAERYNQFNFSGTYGGFFPFLSAGVNYTLDRRTYFHGNTIKFNELSPYVGFNIPLDFSRGRSFTYLNIGSQYGLNLTRFQGPYKDTLKNVSYGYSSNYLSLTHQGLSTLQEVFPHFAQTLDLTYALPTTRYHGYQFVASGKLYFPGLFKTHSLMVSGAYLAQDTLRQINFASGFPFSRGYAAVNLSRMYKWGVNYQLPLLYPDAGFGDLVYLLRVRLNAFYDDTWVKDYNYDQSAFRATFRSAGLELFFDTKWWNQASVSIGLRYSHLFDPDLFGGPGPNRWEIILPVNIFNQN